MAANGNQSFKRSMGVNSISTVPTNELDEHSASNTSNMIPKLQRLPENVSTVTLPPPNTSQVARQNRYPPELLFAASRIHREDGSVDLHLVGVFKSHSVYQNEAKMNEMNIHLGSWVHGYITGSQWTQFVATVHTQNLPVSVEGDQAIVKDIKAELKQIKNQLFYFCKLFPHVVCLNPNKPLGPYTITVRPLDTPCRHPYGYDVFFEGIDQNEPLKVSLPPVPLPKKLRALVVDIRGEGDSKVYKLWVLDQKIESNYIGNDDCLQKGDYIEGYFRTQDGNLVYTGFVNKIEAPCVLTVTREKLVVEVFAQNYKPADFTRRYGIAEAEHFGEIIDIHSQLKSDDMQVKIEYMPAFPFGYAWMITDVVY